MKKKYIIIFSVFTMFLFNQVLAEEDHQNKKCFLLSFPRSGNTWIRYCIEVLTNRPTTTYEQIPHSTNLPLLRLFQNSYEYQWPIVYKAHFKDFLYGALEKGEKLEDYLLILVVRNYKECLIRHMQDFDTVWEFLQNEDKFPFAYIDNIKIYEKWNSQKRLLIYYEDIISNFSEEMKKIMNFLGQNDLSLIENFNQNYKFHKKKMIYFYDENVDKSQTKGESILYHQKNLTANQLFLLDKKMQSESSETNAILKRYY